MLNLFTFMKFLLLQRLEFKEEATNLVYQVWISQHTSGWKTILYTLFQTTMARKHNSKKKKNQKRWKTSCILSWSSQTLQYAYGWCRSGRPVSLYSNVNLMSKQWCYRNFLKWLVCVCKFACHLQLFKTEIKFFIIPSIRGPESFCKKINTEFPWAEIHWQTKLSPKKGRSWTVVNSKWYAIW